MYHRVLWLMVIATLIACGYLSFHGSEQEKEITELHTKIGAMTVSDHDQQNQLTELKDHLAKAEEALLEAQKDSRRKADAANSTRPRVSRNASDSKLRNDPGYAAFLHRQELRDLNRVYGEELAKLNLSPDKLAKVKDLLIARSDAIKDARETAQDSGLDRASMKSVITKATNDVDDEIKNLVGPDTFAQVQATQKTSETKMIIQSEVGVDMTSAGTPLSSDQVSALAKILIASQNVANDPLHRTMAVDQGSIDSQTGLTPQYQVMLNQATNVLSPAQIPILQQYFSDQIKQQQYLVRRTTSTQAR
ncbi:MAG TPA: hypothetical protein VK717_01710 [Opitutaceae bacterium]|jgi:hypothetical protein|nr:hypothetical protein [Opitutaceae bacterium]